MSVPMSKEQLENELGSYHVFQELDEEAYPIRRKVTRGRPVTEDREQWRKLTEKYKLSLIEIEILTGWSYGTIINGLKEMKIKPRYGNHTREEIKKLNEKRVFDESREGLKRSSNDTLNIPFSYVEKLINSPHIKEDTKQELIDIKKSIEEIKERIRNIRI